MAGLLDMLFGGGQPQAQTGPMPAGYQGQIKRGPDGQNYQYAQTTGMQGATGDNGWIRTNQEPSRGLFSGRLGALNDPSIALPLAGALMQPGNLGANLGQGFALAGQGAATRKKLQQEQLQQNMTAKYLETQGADAGLVELAKSGAGAQALQLWQAGKKDPMNELNLQKTQLEINNLKNGGGDKFYGNPIYGTDAQGNTVVGQMSESGDFKPLDTQNGFKPSSGVEKIDMGTQWGLYDKRTGNIIGYQPKDVAGEASQTAQGRIAGETQAGAAAALPAAKLSADTAIAQADDLINDKYLPNMLGKTNSMKPNWSPESNRVQNKLDQLGGTAFLQARQALKGGGAITDMEGDQAKAALVRAGTAQSYDDFKTAVEEYKDHLRKGFAILEQQARGGGAAVQPPAAPQGGVSGTTSTNVPFRVVQ